MINLVEKTCEYIYHLFPIPDKHPWDYLAHFVVSFIGVFVIFAFLSVIIDISHLISLIIAATVMTVIGAVKEIMDKYLGKKDVLGDMTANIIGIIGAVLFIEIHMAMQN